MAHFDPTIRLTDLWLPVLFLLGLGFKAYRVPFIETKLDDLIEAFSKLTAAVARLEGSFETYKEVNKEINFGKIINYKSQSREGGGD